MKRFSKVLVGVGVVLVLVAALWGPMVVPRVVKFPTDVDRTDRYSGTFVTFLDASTGATLAQPLVQPLTIDRRVASVPGATGADVALLQETATAHMGDRTVVQANVYAVNRGTMQNVADPRAWTFTPGNVVDRTGSYYVTTPMDMASTGVSLPIWKPEAGTTYPLTSMTPATGSVAGTGLVYLWGDMPAPLPVAPYERAALEAQGLPMALTPAQAGEQFAAAGVDVNALAPVLGQVLTPDELATVSAALAAPVPLQYFVYGHGRVGVEPNTGGLVELSGIVDGIAVHPDPSAVQPVIGVLASHKDVPAIASLVTTLEATIAAPPQPVYEMRYTQTPASVAEAARYTGTQADKVALASTTIPRGILALGLLTLLTGGVLVLRLRTRRQPAPVTVLPVESPKAA